MESKQCHCGKGPPVATSWTDTHPGRRFILYSQHGANACAFFMWVDPSICARSL
ncbi:hypothetical protein RHMOL_Rhmol13G0135800 [Rhododendron molle]|uniref:Uncharacterized protein n=1 Tax=Rhododendron molle TaxID=49168 RepID=A0ACC0L7B6_RHOML|nr:hypothetical protein RHMOL_Rhmol13G0135800 [Rhododendron molle]